LSILREGYERFFSPIEETKMAAFRNTKVFLDTFLPGKDIAKDVIEPARQRHQDSLRTVLEPSQKIKTRSMPWLGLP
jgi:hypothetical protein